MNDAVLTNYYPRVKPADLPTLGLAMARSGLAMMLYGSPGIGKTALIQGLGKDPKLVAWSREVSGLSFEELPVVTLSAPELNVEDLLGVPTVEELLRTKADGSNQTTKVTRWAIPAMLDPSRPFILFIDEPNRCDPSVRNALFQLITGRTTSSGFALPAGSLACMAGNRLEDRAGVRSLDTAFSNRCGHFELAVEADAWLDWASEQPGFSPLVRAFIGRHQGSLCKFDPRHPSPQQATPRTWAGLGFALSNSGDGMNATLAHGLVGMEAAQLFKAFVENAQLIPSTEEIIRVPDQVPIPSPGALDHAWILATTLCDHLITISPHPLAERDPLGHGVGLILGRLAGVGFEEVIGFALHRCVRLLRAQGNGKGLPTNARFFHAARALGSHARYQAFVEAILREDAS